MMEQQFSQLLWHVRVGIAVLAFQGGIMLAFAWQYLA
jgi:hypothetical protein